MLAVGWDRSTEMSQTAVDFTDTRDDGALAQRLNAWASHLWPDSDGIENLHPMPGNAGLSFGFEVVRGDSRRAGYVIRFAPPGVRKQGNTDVLRQVPLLDFLATTQVPIAPLVWSTSDDSWFGTDAIVQEYLDGSTVAIRDPKWTGHQDFVEQATDAALHALHTIHTTPAVARLPHWEVQHTVVEEAALWARLLEKSAQGPLLEQGLTLRDALLSAEPANHHIGLTHGDFQTNNVLFDLDTGAVRAVVDWELASIGPVGRDLGWLAMMLDPDVWAPEWADTFPVHLDPDFVIGAYQRHADTAIEHFPWYKAYACFKYGAILSFNHYLHTTGKRPDPIYDQLASSRETLFDAGLRLLRS